MGRPATKKDLMEAANNNFEKLMTLIDTMEVELKIPFNFEQDNKKTEAHWKRDKNLRDVYIHLYEWHQLVINWVKMNEKGDKKPFIPEPYNWKTCKEMNVSLWEKHQGTSLEDAKEMLMKSHKDIMELADRYSNEQLFSKGVFTWVGGSTLGSYFVSATASHYDWAMKKLKAHKKVCKG